MNHQTAVTSAHSLFTPLCAVLASAKVEPEPTYDIETAPPPPSLINTLSVTEATILSLTDRLESTVTFRVTETTSIIVKLRTGMQSVCSTNHILSLSPDSPLNITCKAPRPLDQWSKVEEYVLYATSCALASSFGGSLDAGTWEPTTSADTLRKVNADDVAGTGKQLAFQASLKKDAAVLRVKWEHSSLPAYRTNLNDNDSRKGGGSYEWKAKAKTRKGAEWEDGEDEVIRSVRDVVAEAGRS
jgi:hypothetical protein